ncbi:dynein regulatory complex subunit 4-like [Channa argus]|uniref:dynein regulatory complex subunit 4-like n=1 Tax=Channa argus TaxID=215402 RepID=UPI00352127A9
MIETNKAQRRWHISKKHLEETKARIREKLWLKQDAQRRQLAEVQECQQKLIQLETSQHNVICELKLDTIAKTSKTQKEYVESEVELQGKTHLLQVDKREKQSCTGILMRNLKQKQDNELTELKESYKQRASEMEANYDQKVEIMVNEYRTKSISEIQQIDLRMKHLEFEKKKLKQLNSRIATAVQKNKHLRESLQTMEEVSKKSYQELVDKRRSMAQTLKRDKNITVRILEESRDLSFKQQQLESEYAQVEQDYEELKRKHTEATLAKQQKSELRALVLKRQVKAMEEIKERDQLKLWVALAFGQGDKTATENIKELFESKDTTNKDLKDDFYQELQELRALCISKDSSDQKEALGLKPAGADSAQ